MRNPSNDSFDARSPHPFPYNYFFSYFFLIFVLLVHTSELPASSLHKDPVSPSHAHAHFRFFYEDRAASK